MNEIGPDVRVEFPPGATWLGCQVGGEHYKGLPIQPVEYIEANRLQFLEGCVIKRVTRHDKPTGKAEEDIRKAIHELQLLLELRYGVKLAPVSDEKTPSKLGVDTPRQSVRSDESSLPSYRCGNIERRYP